MRIAVSAIDDLTLAQIRKWNELLVSASPVRSAFLSHAFSSAVNEVRGSVFVAHLRDAGGGEGFLPFQIKRGRALLGHAEKVGGSMSDFFGVVGNLRGPIDIGQLLSEAGISSLRFDHAVASMCPFEFLDAEEGSGARLRVDDFDVFRSELAATNKKFLQSVASRERRLVSELGEIVFRWSAERPAEALDQLIVAKRNQYRRTGVPDSFVTAWHRALLRRLLERSAPECTAIVSTLEAGGCWIGSKYSLICADTLHSWFSVYDPLHRRHGPGHQVWFKTLEHGVANGIRVFDFGEGESEYKAQYGGKSYAVWKGAIRQNSLRGKSERLLQSLEWRLQEVAGRRRKSGPEPKADG